MHLTLPRRTMGSESQRILQLLESLHYMDKAWKSVHPNAVINAFIKSCLSSTPLNICTGNVGSSVHERLSSIHFLQAGHSTGDTSEQLNKTCIGTVAPCVQILLFKIYSLQLIFYRDYQQFDKSQQTCDW